MRDLSLVCAEIYRRDPRADIEMTSPTPLLHLFPERDMRYVLRNQYNHAIIMQYLLTRSNVMHSNNN